MKKIGEIKDVNYIMPLFNIFAYNKYINNEWIGLYTINKGKEEELLGGKVYNFYYHDGIAMIQRESSSDCIILNDRYEIIEEINKKLAIRKPLNNYLQIMIREENKKNYYLYNKEKNLISIKNPYEFELEKVFIGYVWEKDVYAYSKETEELLWQKDLSLPEYGVFKDIDGKVYPNKINSPAMADTDTIYLSMAGGQLIALNAEDGSTKWILEGEKKGKCVLYKNLIYKNTGNHLIVIDTDKPQEIKRVSYKDYKDNSSGMTGEFNVYEDVIVMKNQIDENVVVIDRHTLKMIDFVHLKYGIKNSSANCTVWYNNQLYAIDTSDVMHIYELE
ncbi:PQQ-like beta-propeller repeat protein [Weeksellaceae bacterium TAE3-ERU29]|nr:PQQ-like beta-propeller repeat protein [Weeksellaceae bacterium TAE3-ERU29]